MNDNEAKGIELPCKNCEIYKDLLVSVRAIAQRKGVNTNWQGLDNRISELGIGSVTARVFKKVRKKDIDESIESDIQKAKDRYKDKVLKELKKFSTSLKRCTCKRNACNDMSEYNNCRGECGCKKCLEQYQDFLSGE